MTALAHHPDSKMFRPTTLDSALDLISNLRSSLTAMQENLARSKYIETGDFSEEIDDLIRVRAAIKDGRIDDALYDLEKVISTFDSGWHCRT